MWLDLANVHFPKERVEEIRNSEYATGYGITTYCGCWFEDLDFDGTPEFIMGGFNPGWQGGSGYALYKIHDGKMERIFNKHSSHKIDEERPFVYDSVYVDHNYNYKVWMLPGFISAGGAEVIKDKHGDFKYVFPSSGAESPNGGYYLTELTVNSNEFDQPHGGFVRFAYVPDTETKTLYQQCRISDETAESGYRECSQNELLAAVDDFFEDSESYISTIGVIPCSNLMDDKDEKWLADRKAYL